ncbi:LysR family transcriptional regulator [Cohaesibacter celericrescens]|uniref:LysR family transcriptional regulator n=1 Tax=Cohaesibacter celericrescens TaxID=2067669 RepID=UPI003568F80C
MLSLKAYHVFESIFRFGSITDASKHINVSQPAMTQSLLKLEAALGVGLFDRKKGMAPTKASKIFHTHIETGLAHLRTAVDVCAAKEEKANPHLYRQISLSQLKCLHATFEGGSFKSAAQSCGLTLPTVHRSFRSLEALLGVKLAETRPNSVRRNTEGEIFYNWTKLAFREFRQAQSDLDGWKGSYRETFTVGALPLVQSSILPKAVLAFSQEFPHVTVAVFDGTYQSMVRQMQRGEIDFIIGALRGEGLAEHIEQVPLFDDELIVISRVGHPLTKLRTITKRDLAAYPWVMPRKGSPSRAYFDRFYDDLGRSSELQYPIETGSFSLLRCLLQESDRLSVISAQQAHYELSSKQLSKVDYALDQSTRTIGYSHRSGWQNSLPQKRFLQLLS